MKSFRNHVKITIIFTMIMITLFTVSAVFAAAGSLDPTFGSGGKVLTNFDGAEARDIAIQPDGKIVVAGLANNDLAVARYNLNGSLDSTFSTDGKVTTSFFVGGNVVYGFDEAVIIQPDGKIIAASTAYDGQDFYMAMARYNNNGSPDLAFGVNGKVTDNFGGHAAANAAALQSNGKIILAGSSEDNFALARYNSDGSPDTTFGTNGKSTTSLGDYVDGATAIIIQPDNKIIAIGTTATSSIAGDTQIALVRYNSNGTVDTTFGNNGIATTRFYEYGNNRDSWANAAILQPDGKIVIAGNLGFNQGPYFFLVRYHRNGTLDTTFGNQGQVISDHSHEYTNAIALQPDGNIMVGVTSYTKYTSQPYTSNFTLARYTSNGVLDTTFSNTQGRAYAFWGNGNAVSTVNAIAIDSGRRIILAGSNKSNENNNIDFALARFSAGYLSMTFPSIAVQDGMVIESSETSNIGGTFNNSSTTLYIGDNAAKRQYSGILSFSTGGLPDTAVITGATLKIRRNSFIGGTDPITLFQGFMVDLKSGFFGTFPALQALDFQAAADKTLGPASPIMSQNYYNFGLINGINYINKLSTNGGVTQIRLRFKLDDNNDAVANYLSLFSSEAVNAADRPQLVITYYVP